MRYDVIAWHALGPHSHYHLVQERWSLPAALQTFLDRQQEARWASVALVPVPDACRSTPDGG